MNFLAFVSKAESRICTNRMRAIWSHLGTIFLRTIPSGAIWGHPEPSGVIQSHPDEFTEFWYKKMP